MSASGVATSLKFCSSAGNQETSQSVQFETKEPISGNATRHSSMVSRAQMFGPRRALIFRTSVVRGSLDEVSEDKRGGGRGRIPVLM